MARIQFDFRLLPKVSPSDIAQETFLKAKQSFSQFEGHSEGELIAWLRSILATQITHNRRYLEAQCRDKRLEQPACRTLDQSSEHLANLLADRGSSPSARAMRRERAVVLANAIAQLPDDYRDVIIMRHLQGRSFAEIAEHRERTVDSTKGVWRRAIGRLRVLIDQEAV